MSLDGGKRKTYYGKTYEEVRRKLATLVRERDMGLPVVGEKQTVAQYLTAWLQVAKPTIRPRSWRRYEELSRRHIVPTLGKTALARLTAQQVQQLYSAKLEEGLSATTVHYIHVTLRRAFGEAYKLGLVLRNVATLVTPPRPRRQAMHVLAPDEVQRFLAAVADDRLEGLYVLAITSGMRLGELLALKWKDVDLDRTTLQVQATLQRTKDGYVFALPKTAKSRRRVALTTTAVQALRRHRVRQAEERLAAGRAWHDQGIVFTDAVGGPLDGIHVLRYEFTPILKREGLPTIRFHDLRHTAATLMLRQGGIPRW